MFNLNISKKSNRTTNSNFNLANEFIEILGKVFGFSDTLMHEILYEHIFISSENSFWTERK